MISGVRLRVPVTEADHSSGPENAPVVLLEYGDFECPFCGRAEGTLKRIRRDLGQDIRFVFRGFPVSAAHPHATDAARAAEAAGLQGRFWEMHDLLFQNQDQLELANLIAYASKLGLDMDRFSLDFESPQVDEKIEQDKYGGLRSGVNGTPTFFINGSRYDGSWSYDPFLKTLLEVRAEAQKRRAS